MRLTANSVRAVNRLTARWAKTREAGDTVFCATSVWPLLAFLADAAAGPARSELEEAVGMRAEVAAGNARELLAAPAAVRGVRSAVGLWAKRTLPPHDGWVSGLPAHTLGLFSGDTDADRKALETWASDRTDGLIRSMPTDLDDGTELVPAAAQAVRTRWLQPFRESELSPESGPWQGRYLVGLPRKTTPLDRVGVAEAAAGPLTVLKVLGDTGRVRCRLRPDAGRDSTVTALSDQAHRRDIRPALRLSGGPPHLTARPHCGLGRRTRAVPCVRGRRVTAVLEGLPGDLAEPGDLRLL